MHTRGCNSFTAAEYIFGSFLVLSRRIIEGDKTFREKRIERSQLWGNELAGKTIGIVGFGKMGKALSRMARSFGMTVISHSPHITSKEEQDYHVSSVTLKELYQGSDFIALTFPPKAEDRGMFDQSAFNQMKKGVKIVNAAWMGIFNFKDLKVALDNQKVGGIVIDRPEFETEQLVELLSEYPNVVFSPNLGSHTIEGQLKCGKQALEQIINYLENGKITNQIVR
jgi:D-3-phosphoglycerate dehydrogenase